MGKEVLKTYDQILRDQLKKSTTEMVESKKRNSALVHYIPTHTVIRLNSNTTKVRIVYHISAKTVKENKILKECMNQRPITLKGLCILLL